MTSKFEEEMLRILNDLRAEKMNNGEAIVRVENLIIQCLGFVLYSSNKHEKIRSINGFIEQWGQEKGGDN